jgi:hypothetical protein
LTFDHVTLRQLLHISEPQSSCLLSGHNGGLWIVWLPPEVAGIDAFSIFCAGEYRHHCISSLQVACVQGSQSPFNLEGQVGSSVDHQGSHTASAWRLY